MWAYLHTYIHMIVFEKYTLYCVYGINVYRYVCIDMYMCIYIYMRVYEYMSLPLTHAYVCYIHMYMYMYTCICI